MERQKIKSSNIESMGHDGEKLHVEFKGGKVFEYEGVSRKQFDEMMGGLNPSAHTLLEIFAIRTTANLFNNFIDHSQTKGRTCCGFFNMCYILHIKAQ